MKVELDSRYSDYKSGKTNMISSAESKIRIGRILDETFIVSLRFVQYICLFILNEQMKKLKTDCLVNKK